MKNFRLSKNDTAHYSSFEEAAKAFKCKVKKKKRLCLLYKIRLLEI